MGPFTNPESEAGVPLVDLTRLHAPLFDEANAVFDRVVRASSFSLGEDLERFEHEFAHYCGAEHCVGVSDGTEALRLALLALESGPGKTVITVSATFVATVEAIALTGARPVLIDVDPGTRCMSPSALAEALEREDGVVAVVPVHLYGRPAAMDELWSLCDAASVPLLEDACQAHGATIDGRRTGSLGTAAAFSFYPTKNLGAFGDAGAVVTSDSDIADCVRSLRHHGSAPGEPNRHLSPGATGRLDNLQAALLRLKLPHLDAWNDERRRAAARYRLELDALPLDLPPGDDGELEQVFHLFVVEIDDRDAVCRGLRREGVAAAVHYPTPVHLQPGWRALGYADGTLPATEALFRRALSLPMFPGITETEIRYVRGALERVLD